MARGTANIRSLAASNGRIECLAMGKRSRADRLEVAAAKASAGGGAQVHPSDVERHVPTGRSWLWS